MNTKESIEALKSLSEVNPVAKATFLMWALRKRARDSVLVQSLNLRMKREGFTFSDDEYRAVLARVAELGFGMPILGKRGKLRGISDLKVTLQSLGQAIVGDKQTLRAFQQRHRYEDIRKLVDVKAAEIVAKPKIQQVEALPPATSASVGKDGVPVGIVMVIKGRPVSFRIPNEMTPEDIADTMESLRGQFGDKSTIVVPFHGKQVNFRVPKEMTRNDIADMVTLLRAQFGEKTTK